MSESQLQSEIARLLNEIEAYRAARAKVSNFAYGSWKKFCRCVSCGAASRHTRYELEQLATGVRCRVCGGNVVESRFTEPKVISAALTRCAQSNSAGIPTK